jgi:HEPN domain-containing protein
MGQEPDQWFKQAQYDLSTAEAMVDAKKYIYVIFMCHLAIEKALKGLYLKKVSNIPPQAHNLLFLLEKVGISLPNMLSETVFD